MQRQDENGEIIRDVHAELDIQPHNPLAVAHFVNHPPAEASRYARERRKCITYVNDELYMAPKCMHANVITSLHMYVMCLVYSLSVYAREWHNSLTYVCNVSYI
jgi:hypothetical protein